MGNSVILSGYILTPDVCARQNAAAIRTLPCEDAWPALTRDMFAVPTPGYRGKSLLISFGLVYDDLFSRTSDWEQWCTKFEVLLRSLRFDEARVQLDVEAHGAYRCSWRACLPTNPAADRNAVTAATWTRQGPEPVRD